MVIWLRRNRHTITPTTGDAVAINLGLNSDVIPGATFGELLTLEQACTALACEREAILTEARTQVEQLLNDAHVQAQQILNDARLNAEQLLQTAQSEYDTASDHGYEDGLDRARSEWMEQVASSADTQTQMQQRMRQRLAEIVSAAVEQIVSVQSRDALFERALVTIERIVDGATYLRVTVNPQDFDRAQATFERLALRWREAGCRLSLSVTSDKRLGVGSCVCESDCGTIDASLDTQLRAMRDAVSRALNKAIDSKASKEVREAPEDLDNAEHTSDIVVTPISDQDSEDLDYPPPIADGAIV
jgi:type III secretion protein L